MLLRENYVKTLFHRLDFRRLSRERAAVGPQWNRYLELPSRERETPLDFHIIKIGRYHSSRPWLCSRFDVIKFNGRYYIRFNRPSSI